MFLRFFGDIALRVKCLDVDFPDASLAKMVSSMQEVMELHDGVGLAASQVGDNRRVVVIRPPRKSKLLTMINPVITSRSDSRVTYEEGCLSFPGLYKDISRTSEISVEYYDVEGSKLYLNAANMLARIILHEIDHLDGKLFIDHLHWWDRLVITAQQKVKLFFRRG
jgi:peptide deformylase